MVTLLKPPRVCSSPHLPQASPLQPLAQWMALPPSCHSSGTHAKGDPIIPQASLAGLDLSF